MCTEAQSITNLKNAPHCCAHAVDSKWLDVALITVSIALAIISILAFTGAFKSVNAIHIHYICYGTLGAAILSMLTEFFKCIFCGKKNATLSSREFNHSICEQVNSKIKKIEFVPIWEDSALPVLNCEITLTNHRLIRTKLNAFEAYALVHAIEHNKSSYKGGCITHPGVDLISYVNDNSASNMKQNAEQVLTKLLS